MGVLLHDNSGYFFFFPNQTMKPESWQHVCLSVTIDSMKLVLNGEVVVNASPNSVMNEFTETYLWLGGENKPKRKHRRFEGIISDVYLWPGTTCGAGRSHVSPWRPTPRGEWYRTFYLVQYFIRVQILIEMRVERYTVLRGLLPLNRTIPERFIRPTALHRTASLTPSHVIL